MKSRNIAIFGCSWTQGLKSADFDNWVVWLSKMYPQHNFYNFAAAGSAITYHTHLLEQVMQDKTFDVKLFQITSPGRFTWWKPHKVKDILYQKYDNYHCLKAVDYENFVERINTGTILSNKFLDSDRKKHKFGVEYYKRLCADQVDLDHRVYINYIKNNVDFYFYHRASYESHIPNVFTELGKKQFYKYVIDNGDHFGTEGNQWQANWIKDQLTDRNIL